VSEQALIRLLVVTPDDVIIDQQVSAVRFQQPDGWQGILAHHAPYITQLVSGVLMYRPMADDAPRYIALFGGTLEVMENMIVVLTAAAEHGDDLEALRAEIAARQAASDQVAMEAHIEFTKVRTALLRALTDLPPPMEVIR
jgi:F-type H+-transporting ATPase subunit epsilon